jgi:hypothetical protein
MIKENGWEKESWVELGGRHPQTPGDTHLKHGKTFR